MAHSDNTKLSRRTLLKGTAALTAGAATLGFSGLFGDYSQAFAQANGGDSVKTMIDLAATAETFACTHYYNVLQTAKINFNAQQVKQMKAALDSEAEHLKFLQANGASPLVDKFYFPFKVWTDLDTFVTVTEQGEAIFVGAYLAAVRRIAELNNPLLAATVAQIVGVEAQHLSLIREIGGKIGDNTSLLLASYYNVSDAGPSLNAFLKGGPGFEGPTNFPGLDVIGTLVGQDTVKVVKPFTDPTAFGGSAATMSATMSATMAGTMSATAKP